LKAALSYMVAPDYRKAVMQYCGGSDTRDAPQATLLSDAARLFQRTGSCVFCWVEKFRNLHIKEPDIFVVSRLAGLHNLGLSSLALSTSFHITALGDQGDLERRAGGRARRTSTNRWV